MNRDYNLSIKLLASFLLLNALNINVLHFLDVLYITTQKTQHFNKKIIGLVKKHLFKYIYSVILHKLGKLQLYDSPSIYIKPTRHMR